MSQFNLKQIISSKQFSREMVETVIKHAEKMEKILEQKEDCNLLKGKIVATLFYEPSTRTRLSFETAVLRLGGKFINAIGVENTSFKKGETLYDTIKVIENYADIIVMRHAQAGSAQEAIRATQKPFLNAGDGAGEHPTQALLDVYTIYKEKGTLDGLTIGIAGDLKFSRTIHSLVYLLSNFKINFIFVSPAQLSLPEEICLFLKEKKIDFQETQVIKNDLSAMDVLYTNRIQGERFDDKTEYEKLKDVFRVDAALVVQGKKDVIILNPLPRVNEIATDVDDLPNAAYFKQVKNSVPVRMALLDLVAN